MIYTNNLVVFCFNIFFLLFFFKKKIKPKAKLQRGRVPNVMTSSLCDDMTPTQQYTKNILTLYCKFSCIENL